MSCFSERLSELILDRKVTPMKVSQDVGVSIKMVYDWIAGNYEISLSNLLKLCETLKCSIEFLAGRSDNELDFIPCNPPQFYDALKNIMKNRNVTTYRLRKDTHCSGGSLNRWKFGGEPHLSTLIELADYFGCTIDQLVGREK